MARFDANDWTNRLLNAPGVPRSWFSDAARAPGGILYALMGGLAVGFAFISSLQAYGKLQTRIATKTDENLDGTSQDFYNGTLPRAGSELDPSFSTRIRQRAVAPLTTGPAIKGQVNAYLAVATPLELCDVFDNEDDGVRSTAYGIVPGEFAVELYSPDADVPGFVPTDADLTRTFTGISQYRVWGLGNHGLGGKSGCVLVSLLKSEPVPADVVDPNVVALVDDCKADGVAPIFRYLYV
jgi:hypothetical protein